MANQQEVDIKINVKTGEAQTEVKDLNKQIGKTDDAAKTAEKSAKKAGGAFSTIGASLKSLGIITIIAKGVEFFTEALGRNQKVADTIAAVFNTISSIIGEFINIVIDVTTQVSKSTNGFDALTKVVSGAITIAFTPFKLAFQGIKLAVLEVQRAWEQSVFGDKDQKRIKELTADIDETKTSIAEVGKNAVQAGKDIYNNFGAAVKSVGDVVSGVVQKTSEINVQAIYNQNKAAISAKNAAELAAARLSGLIEKYDRLAEQQRQIRDDETNSIDDRIAANEKLAEYLEKQRTEQLKQADLIIEAAESERNLKKGNIEAEKAYIDALNQRAAVEAQITGLQSEQKVNAVALQKGRIALNDSVAASNAKLFLDEKKQNAEFIRDEIERLAEKKRIAIEENNIELQRLQNNINNTKAGTQARVDAEIAFKEKKAEISNQIRTFDDQIAIAQNTREMARLDQLAKNTNLEFEFRQQALDNEFAQIQSAYEKKLISETEYNAKNTELTQQRIALQAEETAFFQEMQDRKSAAAMAGLNLLQAIAGENEKIANVIFAIQKGLEIGRIISSASASIGQIIASTQAIPPILPPGVPNPAYISALALGAKRAAVVKIGAATQIAEIAASSISKFKSGSKAEPKTPAASSGGIATAAPIQPQVTAPTQTITQLDNATINRLGSATFRSYVVETDVTNNQEKIKRINRAARLG
jgi:hypothetical protein